jgi:hypothetical protein
MATSMEFEQKMNDIIEAMNSYCQTDDLIKIKWETKENILNRLYCCSEYLGKEKFLCKSCKKYKFCIENMDENYEIICFNCGNDMNYIHYIFCAETCFWCWNCCEVQHIDLTKLAQSGHHINCTNKKIPLP